MRRVPGFCSISIHAERDTEACRVTVQTTWDSMEAIRAYAGDYPAKAVVPDFLADFLLEYDSEVSFHGESILQPEEVVEKRFQLRKTFQNFSTVKSWL